MARYFLRFRHSDTGLTPSFLTFKKASDFSVVTPPTIFEITSPLNGTYYFDYIPTFDIIFEVDGGVSIPTEEVRFIGDTIGPKDVFVDEPLSQVKDDVWDDTVNRSVNTKGDFVEHVGIQTDAVDAPTVFGKIYAVQGTGFVGGTDSLKVVSDTLDLVKAKTDNLPVDPADASDVALAITNAVTSIKGADTRDLTQLAGAGFVTGTDSLKIISDNVDAINLETDPANIANAVWNESLTSHVTAGSSAVALKNSFKILKNRTKINTTLDTLTVYDDDGTSVLYVFNLKDAAGAPSGETPFERAP